MLVLFIVFAVLLVIGIPIAYVIGLSSLVYLVTSGNLNMLLVLPQKLFQGVDSFVLLSIPFYLLAGELMNATGITVRLIHFFNVLLGHVRGALAYVNVISSILFAGISGTATADAAAIGGVIIPAMKKEGYTPEFSAALTSAAATIGPIIPPSMIMILYAVFANESVAALFAAGIVPGLLMGSFLLFAIWLRARRGDLPVAREKAKMAEINTGFRDAVLALVMPFIILGGMLGGVFTATEAAVVAVVYAIFLGVFVYRSLTWEGFVEALRKSAIMTGSLLFIASTGALFAWIMATEQVPAKVAETMLSISDNPLVFLLLVNLLLLIIGTFMDTLAALIILVPVLLPIANSLGISPIQFGIVLCFNLIQGLITPPLGIVLFISSQIAGARFERVVRALLPFLVCNLLTLLLITLFPQLTLKLPELLGY
ncbi:TRAP transporter large permease [Martelella sp. FLE1502]